MKRVWRIILLVVMAVPFTFASCDDDNYYDDYWWDEPVGNGYSGSWDDQSWWNDNDRNASSAKLQMANLLSQKWTGTLIAYYYNSAKVLQQDSFEIDLDFRQISSSAAVGTCTEYSWPVINNQVLGDAYRNVNTYVWYIDDKMNINITYSNGDKCLIDYDDLRLGNYNDGNGTVFDGVMQTQSSEYYKFWTNLFQNAESAKGTRGASSLKPVKIVLQRN